MPDYRRLVSYIYNYEDGKKRNNVGYARIEARNGLCKCTLHITAPSLNDKQLKVYFFRRDNGGLDGIQIGTMAIRSGAGDLKVQTDSEHIMNSPYSIEHMGGMVLYLSNSKFFATEWDDQPINMEVVSTLEKRQETAKGIKEEKEAVKEEKEAIKEEKETDLIKGNNTETETLEEKKVTETVTLKEKKDEKTEFLGVKEEVEAATFEEKKDEETEFLEVKKDEKAASLEEKKEVDTVALVMKIETEFSEVKNEIETELSEEKKEIETEFLEEKNEDAEVFEVKRESESVTIEVKNAKESEKLEINTDNLLKIATAVTEQINLKADTLAGQEQKDLAEQQTMDSNQPVPEDKAVDENINIRKATPVTLAETDLAPGRDLERDKWEDEMTRKYYERERNQNNIPNDRDRERQDRREKIKQPFFEDHPTAKYMYNNFQRMFPFEDNEIAWCVKIEPQDIGLLPTDTWAFGNNSYLLHGYYSYRHLIFARVNDDKEARYILGVPGIYHNRERFMARMFGFENFKSIKKKDRRSGEFGYWYVPIVIN